MAEQYPVPAGFFLQAMADQRENEDLTSALELAVRRYYANYTDATMLDGAFSEALRVVNEETMLDTDLDELIGAVEAKLHAETGRRFRSRE